MLEHAYRKIRSYVRREGRMSEAQQKALATLWPRFGVDALDNTELDPEAVFGRQAPCALEIGFGNGEVLASMAQQLPHVNFLGVEVYRSGTGVLLNQLAEKNLENVRVMHADVTDLLASAIPENSLSHVYIYFPDPWPKKRHHKRRLIQPAFLDQLLRVLKPGAYVHFTTDWPDYAEHAQQVFTQHPAFKVVPEGQSMTDTVTRPSSKFYRRALSLGHPISDQHYQKQG